MTKFLQYIFLSVSLLSAFGVRAFEADFYASESVLNSGRWVKIKVDASGMHCIPTQTLRSWGFSDPARVRVYGYGGRRLADLLSAGSYIDDIPATPSVLTDAGVVFYAAGPDEWELSTASYYHGLTNVYSSNGYYFITESDSVAGEMAATGRPGAVAPVTTAQGRIHHEKETSRATEAGPLFVGEDFSRTRTHSFSVALPGRIPDSEVWMECSFMHIHSGSAARLIFSSEGEVLANETVSATSSSQYVHGSVTNIRKTFSPKQPESFNLTLTYNPVVSSAQAWLDYLSFNYERRLSLPADGSLTFWSNSAQLALEAPEGTVVWDVTDPTRIKAVETSRSGGRLEWTATENGMRSYEAWSPSARMPAPVFAENVAPQNLHGTFTPVDMVIVTPPELMAQANRIAELHRTVDAMEVAVVDQSKIYNEFSSGTYDIGGLRKYFKFLYDKGLGTERPLRFALLLGRATLDHRRLANNSHFSYQTTPWWVVREARLSMSDNDGYGTDDFVAMLEDGSGNSKGLDRLSIAVGRMPMLTPAEGDEIIDKLYQYVNNSRRTGWKNRLIVLADDEDSGVHLEQAEKMIKNMAATDRQQHIFDKIFIDAYEKVGGSYPEARREMFRLLDDGAAWWIFTGHANNHSWTADGMLTYNDINTMYLRNVPLVLASTCDFLRWDGNEISGGEIMYAERYGGCINMISATRPVYISDNGLFLDAFGRQALSRDENGMLVRSGEAYRRAKNDIRNNAGNISSNTNRLRFVFMGDPALALATPSNIIEVTSINGLEPDGENQPTIPALSNSVIEGRILSPEGEMLSDFNGVILLDIFDSDYSVTTLAHGEGKVVVYDRHGSKLYSGSSTVRDGMFRLTVAMPSQIADNFRPATMSLYAYATDSDTEAVGACRDFYVYGFDEPESADGEAPVIELLVLNHDGFRPGDTVNDSPMVIARVSDNIGINLSAAGVGQQMALTVDGFTSYNDVASFYTPASDGSPSGVINYPLEGLTDGEHTLTLRVFDTSGNTASTAIDFKVSSKIMPNVFEVYTDANPASTSASFYVRHDRPDAIMDVTVTVYDLMGHPVWSGSAKGMSDMDVSAPVTWNLCDSAGRRVQRGIYLYRASITADGQNYQSSSRRIAVTAQ